MVDRDRTCPHCGSPQCFPATLYDGFEVGVYCLDCETLTPVPALDVQRAEGAADG